MLKVYKVETYPHNPSKRAIQVSQDLTAAGFIAGLNECRSEYQKSLAIFKENHRRIYRLVRRETPAEKDHWILLCMEERWALGPIETNFGLATLEPSLEEIFWSSWTTTWMQKSRYHPRVDEKEIFRKALGDYIKNYLDQFQEPHVFVSDKDNLEKCLDVLKGMNGEYQLSA